MSIKDASKKLVKSMLDWYEGYTNKISVLFVKRGYTSGIGEKVWEVEDYKQLDELMDLGIYEEKSRDLHPKYHHPGENSIYISRGIFSLKKVDDWIKQPISDSEGKALSWSVFRLNIKGGTAIFSFKDRKHTFNTAKLPYKITKLLIEKRLSETGAGETYFDEIAGVTGIKDVERIKQTIRDLRRSLGINRDEDPSSDIFQPTGKGYKLVVPG